MQKGGREVEKMNRQLVVKQLGDLEVCAGSIEEGLECLFRRLIRSRASLLNIISQKGKNRVVFGLKVLLDPENFQRIGGGIRISWGISRLYLYMNKHGMINRIVRFQI